VRVAGAAPVKAPRLGGVGTFLPGTGRRPALQRFAAAVIPALRAATAAERGERRGEAGATAYSGRVRGSPNLGRTLLSVKPVMARIRPSARVRTISPCAWPIGACGSRR
jgi:hypothetical protein